jgi:hypothetical protein
MKCRLKRGKIFRQNSSIFKPLTPSKLTIYALTDFPRVSIILCHFCTISAVAYKRSKDSRHQQYAKLDRVQYTTLAPLIESNQPSFLNPSTPRLGTSSNFSVGTPSALLLSIKLLHSITTSDHSASALPAYLASVSVGLVGVTSLAVAGIWPTSQVCAGAGRRGGESLRFWGGGMFIFVCNEG